MSPLAISIGDPAGIGPEIIVKAWLARESEALPPFVVVWGSSVLEAAAAALGVDCPIETVESLQAATAVFDRALPVMGSPSDLANDLFRPGAPDAETAELAYGSLGYAITLAKEGYAAAVVTAPVSKAEIAAVATDFIGQTELLADNCNIPHNRAVMLLAGPQVKAIPLTVHCALSEVPARITNDLVVERATIAAHALTNDFGIPSPHIAVCGLNPHAGEDGRMGDEEIREIIPAIEALQAAGINATGPHPADAIFAPHKRGTYDAVLAMYHDQALAPMKALDFDQGVNVTLGLPIVRTSPDHGTAFDIAGKGVASASSMIAAIRMAGEMAQRRAAP